MNKKYNIQEKIGVNIAQKTFDKKNFFNETSVSETQLAT